MIRQLAMIVGIWMVLTMQVQAKNFAELFPHKSYENANVQAFLEKLDYMQGSVPVSSIGVTFSVPEGYYFLAEKDAESVLVTLWGNPPGVAAGVLGMIFPATSTPFDETWGAAVSFDEDGYVTDENVGDIDYDEMLQQMQSATEESNAARQKQGFEKVSLIDWAAEPYYDRDGHKLHWAKELQFGITTPHTLNYNVRVLGRRGVLNINFISEMDRLPVIQSAVPVVMNMPRFEEGARYSDYIPGTDKIAAYGIGGLIAGKALAKVGILAALLVFLKKGWILVVLALGGIWAVLKRYLRRRSNPKA